MHLRLAVAPNNTGVMSGGDEVGVELLAIRPELAELQPVVANNAGVGRPTVEILVGEIVDDALEVLLEIQSIKGDIELISHPPCVSGVQGAATAARAFAAGLRV